MLGIGAMIAAGHLALLPTLAWAIAGAIIGDGVSYLIGKHYHQRLKTLWPFRNHPKMMLHGIDFFHRHGGKSVFFARFLGPVRPLLPAVAGMLDMPGGRFFLFDIVSACLWAPAYILPGVILGASLGLVAQAAGRLAILIALIVFILWFCWWFIMRLARFFQPHAYTLRNTTLHWARQHRTLKPITEAFLDPEHPEAKGMTVLTLLMLIASWFFLSLAQDPLHDSLIGNLNLYVFNLLQNLRNPWGDAALLFITRIASAPLLYLFTAIIGGWLLWKKNISALLHWLVVVLSVGGLTTLIKHKTAYIRPIPELVESMGFSFPSAHTSLSMATFGFLAILVARELQIQSRWLVYTFAMILIALISFSRLYLGAHWLSDVLGGLSLGTAWVALLGIAYRSNHQPGISLKPFLIIIFLAFSTIAFLGNQTPANTALQAYTPESHPQQLQTAAWEASQWQQLPAWRQDLIAKHHHPINLQWAGNLDAIANTLYEHGWKSPTNFTLRSFFQSLQTNPDINSLPILPQIHEGRKPLLVRYMKTDNSQHLLILRLWQSNFLTREKQPIWIGNISHLYLTRMKVMTILESGSDFNAALDSFRQTLPDQPMIEHRRTTQPGMDILLISEGIHPGAD